MSLLPKEFQAGDREVKYWRRMAVQSSMRVGPKSLHITFILSNFDLIKGYNPAGIIVVNRSKLSFQLSLLLKSNMISTMISSDMISSNMISSNMHYAGVGK